MQDKPQRKPGRPIGKTTGSDTRERIIAAAIDCFARDGYGKASNKVIALQAGVSAPTLYHYFDSKAMLYRCALDEVHTTLITAYRSASAELPDASSIVQLVKGLENVIELSRHQPGLMRFAATAISEVERHEELDWFDEKDAQAFPNVFRELLMRARRRGELGRGIDIGVASRMLVACLTGLGTFYGEAEFVRMLRTFERMLRGEFMLSPSPAAAPPTN